MSMIQTVTKGEESVRGIPTGASGIGLRMTHKLRKNLIKLPHLHARGWENTVKASTQEEEDRFAGHLTNTLFAGNLPPQDSNLWHKESSGPSRNICPTMEVGDREMSDSPVIDSPSKMQ